MYTLYDTICQMYYFRVTTSYYAVSGYLQKAFLIITMIDILWLILSKIVFIFSGEWHKNWTTGNTGDQPAACTLFWNQFRQNRKTSHTLNKGFLWWSRWLWWVYNRRKTIFLSWDYWYCLGYHKRGIGPNHNRTKLDIALWSQSVVQTCSRQPDGTCGNRKCLLGLNCSNQKYAALQITGRNN